MPPYVIYSILSLILFSFSIIAFRLTAKHAMPSPKSYYFWYMVLYFLLGFSLPFFQPIDVIPSSIGQLYYNIPYSLVIFIGIYCFALAIYRLDVTTVAPLSSLNNVFTPILAFFILGEMIPLNNIPWFILIIVAGLLSAYDEKLKLKSFFNKNIAFYIIFVLSISIIRIIANKGIHAVGYWNFTFYQFFYASIFLLPLIAYPLRNHIKVGIKPVLFMIPGVLFEFLGLLFGLKAYSYQVIIPTVIGTLPLAGLLAFTLSRFNKNFLEYHPMKTYIVRFIGMAIATFGIIKLVMN